MIPGLFFSSNLGEKVKRKAQGTGNTRVRHANEPRVSPIVSSATRITALRFSHDSAFIWKRIEKQREASKSEWVLLMGRIFENRLDREAKLTRSTQASSTRKATTNYDLSVSRDEEEERRRVETEGENLHPRGEAFGRNVNRRCTTSNEREYREAG